MHLGRHLADGALHLGMAGVANQDDLAALGGITAALVVHLGDQRAGRVDHRQTAFGRQLLHTFGNAMGGEDGHGTGRDLIQLVDEHRTTGTQVLDHVSIVDDLVADVDRRAILLQGSLDDFDCSLHAGAEAAGLGQDDADHASSPKDGAGSAPSRAESPSSRVGYGTQGPDRQCRGRPAGVWHNIGG